MKKVLLCSLVLLASMAHATNQQPSKGGEGGNGYGGDGYGLGVGIAGAEATAKASADATAVQGQIQGQQQGQIASGGDAKATGGAGGNATGGKGGNASGGMANAAGGTSNATGGSSGGNSINVQGSTYEQAASTAYAPSAGAPRTSCRLFIGFGGSQVGGSLSGGIPIGNDQTCVSGAQIEFMNNVNKVAPGTFTGPDYLIAACKVEGMDQMTACKK